MFSISAPQWTEEDERQEIENLTEEELAEIENDLRPGSRETGSGVAPVSSLEKADYTNEIMEESCRAMQEVLEAVVAPKGKAAYLRAMQAAPDLVAAESNPRLFLKRESFDVEVSCCCFSRSCSCACSYSYPCSCSLHCSSLPIWTESSVT